MATGNTKTVESHIYGVLSNAERDRYEFWTTGNYQGSNCLVNGSTVFVKFDHYCDNNLTTYGGEYLQWTFPFYVEPKQYEIVVQLGHIFTQ